MYTRTCIDCECVRVPRDLSLVCERVCGRVPVRGCVYACVGLRFCVAERDSSGYILMEDTPTDCKVQVEHRTHTGDFQAMGDTWSNDIFVSIANAVKSGTDLPAIFFTDRVGSWIAVVWVLSL